jgi:hypothetical protein
VITALPTESSFGHHVSEAALATALALPVIFAFTELRGTWLVRGEVPPQLVSLQRSINGDPEATRISSSVIMTFITPQAEQGWNSVRETAFRSKEVRASAKDVLTDTMVGHARVQNGRNLDNRDPVADAKKSSQDNRPDRTSHQRGLGNPRQTRP